MLKGPSEKEFKELETLGENSTQFLKEYSKKTKWSKIDK